MHRFFLTDEPLSPGSIIDLRSLRHQLSRVLRMQAGDQIVLLDGRGAEYVTALRTVDESEISGLVLDVRAAEGEPAHNFTLYQCALKSDKMEWVLQKGTELGVSRFVPVISERTIVRPADKVARKAGRWREILREAAEQCRRGRVPVLAEPITWREAVVNEGDGPLRLVLWEGREEAGGLVDVLRTSTKHKQPADVSVLIGPEGGISEAELDLALAQGWNAAQLGPRILRAETAALAAVTIVMSELGEME